MKRVKKENSAENKVLYVVRPSMAERKKKIMEMIEKAGSEKYETSWNKAGVFSTSKKKSEVKKGRLSRAQGARFELKVRKDLEEKGRVVDKWNNNVDLEEKKLVVAKKKYNPVFRFMFVGVGFPDFISFKQIHDGVYSVIGVEVKMNGILSKIEKQKCVWYLQNKIFSEIWIAKKGKKRGQIEYDDFVERYGKKYNKT